MYNNIKKNNNIQDFDYNVEDLTLWLLHVTWTQSVDSFLHRLALTCLSDGYSKQQFGKKESNVCEETMPEVLLVKLKSVTIHQVTLYLG